ncbi:ABC-F family ATP-binding cassette domain-containing protein [Myxococcota bacterium]|nr:ABC-F family ATP-binding cassette domain-containing protein [Myxococcota bacterium]MBU1509389.1 ABC-F family ATP-binding cassette domain-containing protein [Myxococcota bacterium]
MAVLSCSNINLSFGARVILENVSFAVDNNDRIGLVGSNGRGKTTLMRIVSGEQKADTGDIVLASGARMGYLPQEIRVESTQPLLDFVHHAAGDRRQLEADILATEQALEAAADDAGREGLAISLAELHERMILFDSLYSVHEAEQILDGLGFRQKDLTRPLAEFSGGWKMRALLGSLLFLKPDVLLLDEPTNHLDLPSLAWLDTWLLGFRGAYVMISHDRDFLDRHVRRVFSLETEGFRQYRGNYSDSRRMREEEEVVLENRKKNLDRSRKEAERFIERFKAQATKARQAKSKAKMLKKMEAIDIPVDEQRIKFRFPAVERTGDRVLQVQELAKSFGDLHLYRDLDATVTRGERIGIVGVNGAGKTTLLRLLSGELSPDLGKVTWGSNVQLAYYAQHHADALQLDATVLEEVRRGALHLGDTRVRSILGAFLFRGDDVEKVVGVLSGGEKARVALAKLLVTPGNVLLMDEPTNHLDLESAELLAEALAEYEGTMLFVSHNRSFIDRLATRIWEIDDGKIHVYPGNLTEYMGHLAARREHRAFTPDQLSKGNRPSGYPAPRDAAPAVTAPSSAPAAVTATTTSVTVTAAPRVQASLAAPKSEPRDNKLERRRREAQLRERIQKELGPMKIKVDQMEARISELETRNAELSKLMADPEVYGRPEFVAALKEFRENEIKLEELMGRWTFSSEKYEEKKREIEADHNRE